MHWDIQGYAMIFKEHGFGDMSKKLAECKGLKCTPLTIDCCCYQLLYNQPDFEHINSILETACKAWGLCVVSSKNPL